MANFRLKELRKNEKLTQQELAKKIGLNHITYSNYEKGNREPPTVVLIKIADFFGVSLDYLCGREVYTKFYFNSNNINDKVILDSLNKLNDTEKQKIIGYIDCLSTKK